MKLKLIAFGFYTIIAILFTTVVQAQNSLSAKEKNEGWQLLFGGKTMNGWRDAYKDSLPKGSWKIEAGVLHVLPKKEGDTISRGDIVTQKLYSSFELLVDFKMTEGTNSGIKYFVDNRALGLEYQIIDDERHPDAKQGKNGNRTVSSLYDLIPAIITKHIKPMGEWNTASIISNGQHVEHWLNGILVLQYERGSDAFKALINDSKYKPIAGFGLGDAGRILLQDHGDEVYFKNIKIRELKTTGKLIQVQ